MSCPVITGFSIVGGISGPSGLQQPSHPLRLLALPSGPRSPHTPTPPGRTYGQSQDWGRVRVLFPPLKTLSFESVLPDGRADSQVGGPGEVGCRGKTPGFLRTSERHPLPSLPPPSLNPTRSPLLFTSHYPGLAIISV